MTEQQERRASGLSRVPLEALVEICGRDVGGAPAFEDESVDVSGRGMHVRTAYLPEIGSPLVCRFEHDGREIVVEGEVAWCDPAERGGEFGIKFTALDSGSVDALASLCGLGEKQAEPEPEEEEVAVEQGPEAPEPGARVRLHIDGLGSPMKASVRQGTQRRVHVSSNLEFLKVGRPLELEDLSHGGRRPAEIHAVDVVSDPQSRVPQLVVSLRFSDVEEHTPEPSVIDSEVSTSRSPVRGATFMPVSEPLDMADDMSPEAPAEFPEEDEVIEDAGAMRDRLGVVAAGAGEAAKKTGAVLAHVSVTAASGMGRFFKGAGAKIAEYKRAKSEKAEDRPRRTTAAPPSGVLSVEGRRLRPQSQAAPKTEASPAPKGGKLAGLKHNPKAKKIAGAGALVVLLVTVGVIAMKKPASPPGADVDGPAVSMTVAAESPSGDVTAVDEQGNPIATDQPPAETAKLPVLKDAPPASSDGVTADVPLFGPTPMATMEPAPLGPPPELATPEGAGEDEEAKEKAAADQVEDETWGDKEEKKPTTSKANPADVKPWGRGRLHLPTIHRLRLDQPGGAIKGAINPTGFTVVVPGVKVMESPRGIEKRDSRIARVKTRNGSSGAEITFQFRESVPGYRVRLRRDFVEFLISAPADSKTGAVKSSKKSHKKSSKKKSKKKH